MISNSILLIMKPEVMLNRLPGISDLLVYARRNSGGHGPEKKCRWYRGEDDEEDPGK